jgi:hypothetical protein
MPGKIASRDPVRRQAQGAKLPSRLGWRDRSYAAAAATRCAISRPLVFAKSSHRRLAQRADHFLGSDDRCRTIAPP